MTEPYYDEDLVNLAFLKKKLGQTDETIEEATKNISRHYGSQPMPPYNVGDTWSDGSTIYTCIHSRLVGNYIVDDWTTESGALDMATNKSKVFLRQPTNYQMGDMWLLQSDTDHPLGKKGEILIANKNGKEYIEADWGKELTYVTHEEKVEIDEKLETATNNIASLQTTSNSITARVQATEARIDDTYTKEDIEAMNVELADDLDIVSQRVGTLEVTSTNVTTRVESVEKNIVEVEESITELKIDSLSTVQVKYALSDSATEAPTTGWSTQAPEWVQGAYMWQKTITTYADGTIVESNPTNISGAKGDTGKDGTSVTILGSYNTLEELKAEHPTGTIGDAYIIAGNLYVWSANSNDWSDVGTIQGPQGEQGIPGTVGADGKTSYLHIKYSDDEGLTFTSNNGEEPGDYIGQYVDFVEADSIDTSKYIWKKIKGETGLQGLQGPQGEQGIQGPKGDTGAQGIQGEKGETGASGEDGKTTYFHIKYSPVENPTASQITEIPNTYIGTYVDFTETDSDDPNKYTWYKVVGDKGEKGDAGAQGEQGVQGEQGIPGTNGENGQTSYLHIKYSNDGGKTFTDNNGETVGSYIGQYVDFTQDDSTNVSDYKWAEIKGEKGDTGETGAKGETGATGPQGDKGDTGIGVKELEAQYYLSNSATTQSGGEWKTTQDSWVEGMYIWTRTKITWTDDTIEYTTPVLADALNSANDKANTAINNQTITATTEEGKSFHLPDSADNNCKSVEIFGESTQETRSGKNLHNNVETVATSNASIEKTEEGFVATRTASSSADLFVASYEKQLKPNTTYTFYANRTNAATCYFYSDALWGTALTRNLVKSSDDVIIYTFTTDSTGKVVVGFYSANQTQGDTVTLSNIMILEGEYSSENIPEYEPYGAMPSPEYPSEIESVSGKNKLNIDNNWENTSSLVYQADLEENETYTIKINNPDTSKIYRIKGSTHRYGYSNFDLTLNSSNNYTSTFVYSINEGNIDKKTGVVIWDNETSEELTIEEAKNLNIQIEKGKIATFYVPYNHIGFRSIGKNYLNIPSTYELTGYKEIAVNIPIGEYIISAEKIVSLGTASFQFIVLECANKTKVYPSLSSSVLTKIFTLTEPAVKIIIYSAESASAATSTTTTFTNLMIKKNTDNDTYESYKESITAIPLLHDMRGFDNATRDEIEPSNSKWYDKQNVGKVVLNGEETFTIQAQSVDNIFYTAYKILNMKHLTKKLMSNYFVKVSSPFNTVGIACLYENYLYFGVSIDTIGALSTETEEEKRAKFKTWLSNNNVEVIYELAEPIITEITDEATIEALESIKTFKGITNITADAPSMLTYYRDVPMVDEYETKQNANKTYKAIRSQFADFTIEQDNIKATVSETITKVDEQGNKIGEVESSVNEVKLTAEENSSEIKKKVGNDEVISKINQSAEEVQIDANRISLKRFDY